MSLPVIWTPEAEVTFQAQQRIHYCVINPYVPLYYKLKEEQIDLLLFWPNRQNPENLPI